MPLVQAWPALVRREVDDRAVARGSGLRTV